MMKRIPIVTCFLIVLLCFFGLSCQLPKEKSAATPPDAAAPDSSWAMLPFSKIDSVNPILLPGDNVFICPVRKKEVKWEEKDVFNPAAVVRNGKVYLLYRAEDVIGKH